MVELYIEIVKIESNKFLISIESFVALFTYEFLDRPKNIDVILLKQESDNVGDKLMIPTNINETKYQIIEYNVIKREIKDFKLPIFRKENTYVAGMCAVCREIIKSDETGNRTQLLGFKESCLLAPTEHSIWTRFCEIDIIECLKFIWKYDFSNLCQDDQIDLPEVLTKFECHMSQPIRVHNMYKVIREEIEKRSKVKEVLEEQPENGIITKDLLIKNRFAEGYWLTLADVILFICFSLIFNKIPNLQFVKELLPLTFNWYGIVTEKDGRRLLEIFTSLFNANENKNTNFNTFTYKMVTTKFCSLYKSDPKSYKPKNRIFTRQEDIDNALRKLKLLDMTITSENMNKFHEKQFDWDLLHKEARPEYGDLPEKRLSRKKDQLENVAKAIVSLAKDGDRIVDFCSGSGHLGLILASKLPNCHIIFLENKERSLSRARERIEKMNLKNVSFYQCNLDYFEGDFDIGTSLHACGTATDIVISKCLRSKAKFVCCPCCYGRISPMPHIPYPLSKKYNQVILGKDYLHLAHAADQSHDKSTNLCNIEKSVQGEYCMDIIDTDRKTWAEEFGYNVLLTRLKPENCSLKNRLLIGVL